ncbi:hyaluronan mediated motility receptor [Atheta coriaria]|uniref:hyaluronan mediated motility receptor n=1 Tax=Dalotia coriaria TaxID=877792 RepID=UPI0031F3A017
MSFSRAKITRFNEAVSVTPSPADYNVKLEQNAKGAVISRSDRFVDGKSPHSDCGSSVNSVHTVHSTPCFRTPTLPKKKKTIFTLSGRKTKPTDLFSKNKKKSSDVVEDEELDLEALKDKIVECHNKDIFIKDLTEQIEEMKEELNDLERQKEKLTRERCKFSETCDELREEHRIMMQKAFLEYDTETNDLKLRIRQLEAELLHEQETLKQIRADDEHSKEITQNLIDSYKNSLDEQNRNHQQTIEEKERIIIDLQKSLSVLQDKLDTIQKDHDTKILSMQKKHKDEIMDLEFTMLKTVTETQNMLAKEKATFEKKLTTLTQEHKQDKAKLLEETHAKIKQIEEDAKEANVLAEIQMQERCKDIEATWQMTYEKQRDDSAAILKECQAIGEYSIQQCEWEKNAIKADLAAKIEELKQFERDNADLHIALQEADMKYHDLLERIDSIKTSKSHELEKSRTELAEMQQQKKLYEISITKAHETIDTLKKRLLDSDHDVEQLKSELESCELSKLEFEARCNQLRDELELVAKHSEAAEEEYHDTLKKTDDKIAELEINLIRKVEEYKAEALTQIDELMEHLHQKECDLQEVFEQLHHEHNINKEAHSLIEKAQTEIDAITTRNEQLQIELSNVKEGFITVQEQLEDAELKVSGLEVDNDDLRMKLDEMEAVNRALEAYENKSDEIDSLLKQLQQMQEKSDSYSQYCDYYKHKATLCEKEIEELEGINKKYIEQSGKYDALLQQFEAMQTYCAELEKKTAEQDALIGPFRSQLEAYEVERNALVSQKAAAEDEAKQMGFKYAQLLGHQNQRQKIKHLMDLKAKNYDLIEEKKDLECKLKSHAKTIEKLNKQLSAVLHSPRKSKIHSTDKENVASPNRTLNNSRVESPGPLRERN